MLLMLLGLDEDASTEIINQQLDAIAGNIQSVLIDVKLDEQQIAKIKNTIEGLSGNFESLQKAISTSTSGAIKTDEIENYQATLGKLQAQIETGFKKGSTVQSFTRDMDGSLNKATVKIRDFNGEVSSIKATLQDGEWKIQGDIGVQDTFEKEIKESLKSYKELYTEINKISKKEIQGTATTGDLERKEELEAKAYTKASEGLAALTRAKDKDIISTIEMEQRTKELFNSFEAIDKKGELSLANTGSAAEVKEDTRQLNEYKNALKESLQIEAARRAGKGTTGSEARVLELKAIIEQTEKATGATAGFKDQLEKIKQDSQREETKIIDEEEIKKSELLIKDVVKSYQTLAAAEAQLRKAQATGRLEPIGQAADGVERANAAIDHYQNNLNELVTDEVQRARVGQELEVQKAQHHENEKARIALEAKLAEERNKQITIDYGKQLAAKNGSIPTQSIAKVTDAEGLKNYLKQLGYVNAEVQNFSEKTLENGRILGTANIILDTKAAKVQKMKVALDGNTDSLIGQNTQLSTNANRMTSFQAQIGKATEKILAFSLAGALLYGTLRKLKEGVTFITDLDKALTQVAIVQGKTREQVSYLAKDYAELGAEMGKTVTEISNVNTELVRQGLSLKESEARMKTILQLSSVGAISADASLKIVTASVNALRVGHERAADVIVKASQISASSVEEIGEAFTKTASSAYATGMQLEQVGSILSTLIETTQEGPSQLGTSLKTILARFSRVNEETGEFNDQLNDVQSAVESVGVAFTDADGQIRNVYDILRDLSGEWVGLTKNQKAYVATQAAGVRQQNRFFALMNNFNRTQQIHNELINSAGTLTQGYSTYLTGLEASSNRAQVALEKLWIELIDSDTISTVLGFLTSVLTLMEKIGAEGAVLGIVVSGVMLKNIKATAELGKTLLTTLGVFKAVEATAGGAAAKTALFGKSIGAATVGVIGFSLAAAGILAVAFAIGLAFKALQNWNEEQKRGRQERLAEADDYIQRRKNYESEAYEIKQLDKVYSDFQSKIARGTGTAETSLNQEELEAFYDTSARLNQLMPNLPTQINQAGKEVVTLTDEYSSFFDFFEESTEKMKRNMGENSAQIVKDLLIEEDLSGVEQQVAEQENNLKRLAEAERELTEAKQEALDAGYTTEQRERIMLHKQLAEEITDLTEKTEKFEKNGKKSLLDLAKNALPPLIANFENLNEEVDKFPNELLLLIDQDDLIDLAKNLEKIGTEEGDAFFQDFFNTLYQASQDGTIKAVKEDITSLNEALANNDKTQAEYEAERVKGLEYVGELIKEAQSNIGSQGVTPGQEAHLNFLKILYKQYVDMEKIQEQVSEAELFEGSLEALDKYHSSLSSLESAYSKVKDGQALVGKELTDLLQQFPDLNEAFAKTGDATFANGEIIKAVAKTAKMDILTTLKTALDALAKVAMVVDIDDPREEQKLIKSNKSPYGANSGDLDLLRTLIKAVESDMSDFDSSVASGSKATAEYFDLVARRLASLDRELERTTARYDDAFTFEEKELAIEDLIKLNASKTGLLKAAMGTYQNRLNEEIKKIKAGTSLSIDDILIGNISLDKWGTFNDSLKESIKNAQTLNDTVEDLTDQMNESARSTSALKLERITLEYEKLEKEMAKVAEAIALIDHKRAISEDSDYGAKMANNIEEANIRTKELIKSYDKLMILRSTYSNDGSAAAAEHKKQMDLVTESIIEHEQALFSIQSTNADLMQEYKDLVRSLIESELQEKIDKHEIEIDQAKEYLSLQLKQIDSEQKLLEYQKSREASIRKLTDLKQKEAALQIAANQGDRKAQDLLRDVQDQIIEEEERKDELVSNRSIEIQKETLQEQYERFEEIKKKEIDLVNSTLKNAEEMAERTNKRIGESIGDTMETLLLELDSWNVEHGDGITNNIIDKWKEVIGLVESYNAKTGEVVFAGVETGAPQSGSFIDGYISESIEAVKARMQARGALWGKADQAERNNLNALNQMDAQKIGYKYNGGDGRYYPDNFTVEQLQGLSTSALDKLKLYDNGGFKPKGTLGLMGEDTDEWMLTDKQFQFSQKSAIAEFMKASAKSFESAARSEAPIQVNFYGDVNDQNADKIVVGLKQAIKESDREKMRLWKTKGTIPKARL